jgi:hypothetical protein
VQRTAANEAPVLEEDVEFSTSWHRKFSASSTTSLFLLSFFRVVQNMFPLAVMTRSRKGMLRLLLLLEL